MDNRTNKRNTFRPGNLLIASAALLLMMVSMGYTFPFVNQDQKSGISVNNVKWFSTDVGIVSFDGKTWKLFDGNEHIPNHQLKGVAFVENPENVNILSSDVACIASGNDSIRWIGTDTGITSYANRKFNIY